MLSLFLGLAGIALGTLNFFVLAHLAAYPTVQAIVYSLMVYSACAIIERKSEKKGRYNLVVMLIILFLLEKSCAALKYSVPISSHSLYYVSSCHGMVSIPHS